MVVTQVADSRTDFTSAISVFLLSAVTPHDSRSLGSPVSDGTPRWHITYAEEMCGLGDLNCLMHDAASQPLNINAKPGMLHRLPQRTKIEKNRQSEDRYC